METFFPRKVFDFHQCALNLFCGLLVESPILEVVMRANWRISSSMLLVPLITAAAATTTLAAEFPKPVTQWTCAEFLSVDDAAGAGTPKQPAT
jgi:hypothetical protein